MLFTKGQACNRLKKKKTGAASGRSGVVVVVPSNFKRRLFWPPPTPPICSICIGTDKQSPFFLSPAEVSRREASGVTLVSQHAALLCDLFYRAADIKGRVQVFIEATSHRGPSSDRRGVTVDVRHRRSEKTTTSLSVHTTLRKDGQRGPF
ncbi:hypothetical protein EYF80_010532 [Liparis tanakae]|uniref:Uncharacterized protein n=1 Tax=Liparis tanakae TaxID=230148 RepID=A0A4Z2IND5_9TELE|nr:hypothetical protein EYF80_010532 [Liparis tanakae]